jgi:hypothetical protein
MLATDGVKVWLFVLNQSRYKYAGFEIVERTNELR